LGYLHLVLLLIFNITITFVGKIMTLICREAVLARETGMDGNFLLSPLSRKGVEDMYKDLISLFNESKIMLHNGIAYFQCFSQYFLTCSCPCGILLQPFENIFIVGI
jgi:hypothetical protein